MAFETYLTVDKLKPRRGRRITFLVSLAVHGVMLAVGVAMSFAGVEELAPKNGTLVTILTLPPTPPPAAEPKRNPKPRTKTAKLPTPISKNVLVQPTDVTKQDKNEPEEGPPCEGPQCSEIDGPPDGPPGGSDPAPANLPPNVAKGFLAIDPQAPQYRPRMPAGMRHAGMSVWALMRVCVDADGRVETIKVIKGDDASVNAAFTDAIRTWRYQPFKVNGRPVPFCTNVRYEVQTTN